MESLFVMKNVTYKNIVSLDHYECKKGSVTAIVGESGKSTFLRLLNHLISYDSGVILYKNQALTEWDPVMLRREVVMLPQQPVIYKGTIEDNLQIGRLFSECEKASIQECKEMLTFVNLPYDLHKNAEVLSGGEKQRLAWARVMLMDATCYLLDEPTSALDEENAYMIMDRFIKRTKQKQQTVIFVTHSKQIAKTFSNQILTMKKGEANE